MFLLNCLGLLCPIDIFVFRIRVCNSIKFSILGSSKSKSSLLLRDSSIRYINPLCEVYRRHKVECMSFLSAYLLASVHQQITISTENVEFNSGTQKRFLILFRNIFVSATNVSQFAQPKKHHGQQCVRNNVSSWCTHTKILFISNLPKDFQFALQQWNFIFNFLEQ